MPENELTIYVAKLESAAVMHCFSIASRRVKVMSQRSTMLPFLVVLFMGAIFGTSCNATKRAKGEEAHARIVSLIHVGMNVNDAKEILDDNGIKCRKPYHPTVQKDYLLMTIRLGTKRSKFNSFISAVGLPPVNPVKLWTVVYADANGTIIKIE